MAEFKRKKLQEISQTTPAPARTPIIIRASSYAGSPIVGDSEGAAESAAATPTTSSTSALLSSLSSSSSHSSHSTISNVTSHQPKFESKEKK